MTHKINDLGELARALSRVQRWNGDTIVPWTVLQHTLAGVVLIPEEQAVELVYWILHDVEEALTGDIPAPFKAPDQAKLGDEIRGQILRSLKLPEPDAPALERIAALDEKLAAAEAHLLCPLHVRAAFPQFDVEAFNVVYSMLDMTPREAVEAYLGAADELLSKPIITAMARRV